MNVTKFLQGIENEQALEEQERVQRIVTRLALNDGGGDSPPLKLGWYLVEDEIAAQRQRVLNRRMRA